MSKVRFSRVVLVAFLALTVSACSGLKMPDISMPDMPSIFTNKTSSGPILIPRDEYGNPILPKS